MEKRTKLKTYSHLEQNKIPSEYEIVTSNLHYYLKKGFEIPTPVSAWYEKYQKGSEINFAGIEAFSDPRETTYTKYNSLQNAKETFVDGILESMGLVLYDESLSAEWKSFISRTLGVLRFPCHGLQMVSAYVGQMAPNSRVTIASAFQVADEMRRIQRFSYRLAMLGEQENTKAVWQDHPDWQPLRVLIENLLVTYDWSEAFVALNLCVKPMFDEYFLAALAQEAKSQGDFLFSEVLRSLYEDSLWHQEWSKSLLEILLQHKENLSVIDLWMERWIHQTKLALSSIDFNLRTSRKTYLSEVAR